MRNVFQSEMKAKEVQKPWSLLQKITQSFKQTHSLPFSYAFNQKLMNTELADNPITRSALHQMGSSETGQNST